MMTMALALTRREAVRFLRQRSRLIGSIATPIVFWLLIGGGIGTAFRDPSGVIKGGYLEFFFAGAVLLSVLFTAIFSTMSVIEDRHEGFLQGVLVSPAPRSALVAAKIFAGAGLGCFQACVLFAVAKVAGLEFSIIDALATLPLLAAMGAILTALGFVFAWKLDSVQGYHSVMNMVLMPLWILSGSVFPVSESSNRVLGWLTALNPLSYGASAFRAILWGQAWTMGAMLAVVGLVLGTMALAAFAVRSMRNV